MAKKTEQAKVIHDPKKTSEDIRRPKTSSMNKHKKRSFKPYRGQGK